MIGHTLGFARKAALEYATFHWDDRLLTRDELPAELLSKRPLVLIYLLPLVFRQLGMHQSAQFNEIWQYGKNRFEKLREDSGLPGSSRYWLYSFDLLDKQSPTLRGVVNQILADNAVALDKLAQGEAIDDERWEGLRFFIRTLKNRYGNVKEWSTTSKDFRSSLIYPEVCLEHRLVSTWTYLAAGENPMRSDAYGSLGPCAVRSYLFASFRKHKGSETLFMRPQRIGARVWDDYNFLDASFFDYVSGLLADGRLSQFLGKWRNQADGSQIVLHNEDFELYRKWFVPKLNSYRIARGESSKKLLDCVDFHSVSSWVEQSIKNSKEIALPNAW